MKMNRQHVHLSANLETAKTVGRRHGGKLVVFLIQAHHMHGSGYEFYLSDNGVWLTDTVPVQFFSKTEFE
jgi:putative RNA 2'-phosphotransferase